MRKLYSDAASSLLVILIIVAGINPLSFELPEREDVDPGIEEVEESE